MATPVVDAARRGGGGSDGQDAVEEDLRRELARELHDRVAQTLTGMVLEVENFKSQQVGWDDVIKELEMVQSSTRQVLTSLRQLLHDWRGEDQLGSSLIENLATMISSFERKTTISAKLEVHPAWPGLLTSPASLGLYRIAEEALNNVKTHSRAGSVRVSLDSLDEELLVLAVEDDGRGLDTDGARPIGLGMIGMRERALLLGGRLHIESDAGVGTRVRAVFQKADLIAEPSLQ